MNILPELINKIPGLSPQWKRLISQAWEITRGYQNSRSDLLRAIADRNLNVADLQRGLLYLQSGPLAGMLEAVSPGLAGRLHSLGNDIINSTPDKAPGATPAAPREASDNGQHKRGNPFPPLKK